MVVELLVRFTIRVQIQLRSDFHAHTSEASTAGPSVITSSTDFSFQNLVFLEFIWIFSDRNHSKTNICHI